MLKKYANYGGFVHQDIVYLSITDSLYLKSTVAW